MAECPYCKEKNGANDFRPSAEEACSVCGNRPASPPPSEAWWVSAPPLEPVQTDSAHPTTAPEQWWVANAAQEPQTPNVTQQVPSETLVAPEPKEPQNVPPVPAPPPPRLPEPIRPTRLPSYQADVDDDDEGPLSLRDRLQALDYGTVLAFCCFCVALLFGSFYQMEAYVKPLAALGLLAGVLGGLIPALRRRRYIVLACLMSVLCLLVLLFAGSWPSFSPPPPSHMVVPLTQKGMSTNQIADDDRWVDASANAVKLGDVRVEIVSVQIGPVDLKRTASTRASAERCLSIRLRVSYESVLFQQLRYEPWSDRSDSPSNYPPTLTDNQERSYTQKTFDSGWKVVGRADVDALTPGHQVKDVLVYPVPGGNLEYLRLTLPASAFGLTGAFRFQINRSMIRGL